MLTLKIVGGIVAYFLVVLLLGLTPYIKHIDMAMTLLLIMIVVPTLRSASKVMMDKKLADKVILHRADYSATTWWGYSFIFGYFVFRFYAPMADLQLILN